jgi:hypothetical protein
MADVAGRQVWSSGGMRRIVLAFAFLLLLPFYASLGPMLFQRVSRGLVGDTIALGILALAFTALMLLLLQQLIHAVRTRVVVDEKTTRLTVPMVGKRGPFFLFNYQTKDIAHTDIAAIDSRNEVYGGTLAPVLLQSTRLTTKSGDQIVLGYTNVNDQEDQIPFPTIGAEISKRAGVSIVDHGAVRRSVQKRVLGAVSTDTENTRLTDGEIAAINVSHTRNLRLLVAGLALLVASGITLDFLTASRTSYAEMGAGLSRTAAETPAPPKKK